MHAIVVLLWLKLVDDTASEMLKQQSRFFVSGNRHDDDTPTEIYL